MGVSGIAPVSAQLPTLSEKEWLGYFVGVGTKTFRFGITSEGDTSIRILGRTGEPVAKRLTIVVTFQVEEILPDGKTVVHLIDPKTLETTQPATSKPVKTVFRGKVKGDAGFEVTVDETRGGISLGGRLLTPGTLTQNPLRFSIAVKIPSAYEGLKRGADKKEIKAFEEKTKSDRVQVTWADKKRPRLSTTESVDASSKEINGTGIVGADVEFSSYQEKKLGFAASTNSLMTLSNKQAGPLQDGFVITWVADSAKDPEGMARLNIEIR